MWVSVFHRASLLSVTFINQLMHSIITIADVKIYVIQKSKRHTLKILQHASDHKDPASGIDNLYLIEITYNGSIMLIMCLVGVWRHILYVRCAGLGTSGSHTSTNYTHTTGPEYAAKHRPRT